MTDRIPLYPDEQTIALEVMGPKRAKEWPVKAKYLEEKHAPPIDEFMGGRYWPAVEQFFRSRHGLNLDAAGTASSKRVRIAPFKPDGRENFKR